MDKSEWKSMTSDCGRKLIKFLKCKYYYLDKMDKPKGEGVVGESG